MHARLLALNASHSTHACFGISIAFPGLEPSREWLEQALITPAFSDNILPPPLLSESPAHMHARPLGAPSLRNSAAMPRRVVRRRPSGQDCDGVCGTLRSPPCLDASPSPIALLLSPSSPTTTTTTATTPTTTTTTTTTTTATAAAAATFVFFQTEAVHVSLSSDTQLPCGDDFLPPLQSHPHHRHHAAHTLQVENFIDDGERTFSIIPQPAISSAPAFSGYQLPEIRINTAPKPVANCHTITDPNYRQFDGNTFVINTAGTFLLWSAPLRDWEVQSRVNAAGFNCGVAIRDGCSRIVFDRCSGAGLVIRQYPTNQA
jgi:hypothetical protein